MSQESNGILADTCVWIEFFKSRSKEGDRLESLILENSVWICGIVLLELLQGVKSDKERARIEGILSTLQYAEMSRSSWREAAGLSASLKKKGANLPLSDILVATLARRHHLSIYTHDRHFKRIPGVKLYRP